MRQGLGFTVVCVALLVPLCRPAAADESAEVAGSETVSFDVRKSDVTLSIPTAAQAWRSLRIENLGAAPVSTPDLLVPGQLDFSDPATIVADVVRSSMSDADKAMALYRFVVRNVRSWALPSVEGATRPIEILNVYGYCNCTGFAATLATLAEEAGLKARIVDMPGHAVAEIYHDARWHLYDANLKAVYRKPDGTIASVEEVQRDLNLISTVKHRILAPDGTTTERGIRRLYAKREASYHQPPSRSDLRKMTFHLFAEERIEWFRDDRAKFFPYQNGVFSSPPPKGYYAGGRMTYRPDLGGPQFAERWELGTRSDDLTCEDGKLAVTRPGKQQRLRMRWRFPWAVVGGRIRVAGYRTPGDGVMRMYLNRPEGQLQFLAVVTDQPDFNDRFEAEIEFTPVAVMPPPASVLFDVDVELTMFRSRAYTRFEIDKLEVEIDLQRSPQSLPPAAGPLHQLVYRDRSLTRHVRVVVEREPKGTRSTGPLAAKSEEEATRR